MSQQRQLIALAVLLVIAAGTWYFLYFRKGGTAPGSGPVTVAPRGGLLGIDNPSLHWPELRLAQTTEYQCPPPCRNPFSKEAPRPPSPKPTPGPPHPPPGPMPPPPDPPLTLPSNLKFFGFGTVPNGTTRRAFFSDGEDIIIVAEGETLLGRYRILKVNNTNLEFEEIATGRRSTAPLVEDQQASQPST